MKLEILAAISLAAATARGGDLSFSAPENVTPMPTWAVGQACRTADLDVAPGFQKPPAGFGVVPFFWWLGDPLTKERLSWELEQMAGMEISGYQINYAHSDKGGRSCGLTLPSEPALFSPEWWKLTGWFMKEAKKQGAGISLSDYTLGFGQGWLVDEILRENPDILGSQLRLVTGAPPADALLLTTVPNENGKPQPGAIIAVKSPYSLDPMNPASGKLYSDKFFGAFEKRNLGEAGRGLNFFFSDELTFGVSGRLWTAHFAEEFKKRKGYDIVPELSALFMDIGARTPKVRLDYSDVMVSLTEEGFFKPVFDWHQQRGMTMGCDHGGRGRNVVEFGDYFRTQRWNQGPGSDQPGLGKELIKAKVASSIAHLYQRPRVWLEGFYGSGWGTTSAGVVDATFADFVMGYNLLSFHGMYYSTHGGWWEWAAPDNTFRMPYWKHMRGFMECVQRLSYLLSQGDHRCDVAILYPVAPMEADMGGKEAVNAAFDTGGKLYSKSVDFDYMDFESLARAKVVGKELHVSGEVYRVLILPAMKAVRHSTLQKAIEFHRAGGVVLAVGALPEASDRIGRDDPEVAAMVKELFPDGVTNDLFAKIPGRDYEGPGYIQHRRLGPRDLYAIYNAPQGSECFFRATGKVELWNAWTGETQPLAIISQTAEGTKLKLPLTEKEMQLIMFSPGQAAVAPVQSADSRRVTIPLDGDWEFELQPTSDNRFGDFHWPPTPDLIGAEARQFDYTEGDPKNGSWRRVTSSFGPQFIKHGALPANAELPSQGGVPYEFSWRWGVEGDPGHQGYHGLKAEVHDDFLVIGKAISGGKARPTVIKYEADGLSYFSTAVIAPREMTAYVLTGQIKPLTVRLNGDLVSGNTLKVKAGANQLALCYDKPGRTYFVVSTTPADESHRGKPSDTQAQPKFKPSPLTMTWRNNPDVLPFDVRAAEPKPVGWYRFTAPPGLRSMSLKASGKVQAWADGKELQIAGDKVIVPKPSASPVPVLLRIEQERGCYGGAAIPEPIKLDCGVGRIALGDWAKIEGLATYSGGAWYRKTVTLPGAKQVVLDLGEVVASSELRVNGKSAGVRVSAPWKFDITNLVKPGENRIEVLVCNTLFNHYLTVPTGYRAKTFSGLLGPVRVLLEE